MKDIELYGIDLSVLVNGRWLFIVRVPGWVNFGVLKARANERKVALQLIRGDSHVLA